MPTRPSEPIATPSADHEHQFEAQLSPRNTALRRALADIAGHFGRLLELGCGSGRFLRAIAAARPDLETFGCDISPRLVAKAEAAGGGVRYLMGSLTEAPIAPSCIDIVTMFDVLEHVTNPSAGIAEAARVLRPGGMLHALVPCEGQPLTLHWAMWKLDVLADLKERHGGHIQRFTHGWVEEALAQHGLDLVNVRYSMHPIGQLKDVLTYARREDWFRRYRLDNAIYRASSKALWAGAYVEARALGRLPVGAVAMHVKAVKPA